MVAAEQYQGRLWYLALPRVSTPRPARGPLPWNAHCTIADELGSRPGSVYVMPQRCLVVCCHNRPRTVGAGVCAHQTLQTHCEPRVHDLWAGLLGFGPGCAPSCCSVLPLRRGHAWCIEVVILAWSGSGPAWAELRCRLCGTREAVKVCNVAVAVASRRCCVRLGQNGCLLEISAPSVTWGRRVMTRTTRH